MKKHHALIASLSTSIVEVYKYHGLNEALRILYNALRDILPVAAVECVAKPSASLWLLKLFSIHDASNPRPLIKTFDSIMVNQNIKTMIEAQEGNTGLLSRHKDPKFFECMTDNLDSALSTCLLRNSRNMLYLYLYARKDCPFQPEDAPFVSSILHNLSAELGRSFIFPSLFGLAPVSSAMESAAHMVQICPDLKHVDLQIRRIAATDSLVLVTGESGTGKDLIAKAIHEYSERRDAPFVKVNCGAIPDTLLDSELFGHERGAFTGADHAKSGYFEQAEGGTIFLDEIGELSLAAQVRLLHVLENGQIQRVGSQEAKQVNTRIIAATNRDLWAEAERGAFREDLCYRLFVCHVHMPPLRDRKNDIPVLIWYFLNKKAERMNISPTVRIMQDEIQALCAYDWPGNVRELEHTIERSLIYSGDSPNLNIHIHTYQKKRTPSAPGPAGWVSFDDYVADYLKQALEHTGGRVKGPQGAARLLQLNPNTLRSKLLKYGLLEQGVTTRRDHPAVARTRKKQI